MNYLKLLLGVLLLALVSIGCKTDTKAELTPLAAAKEALRKNASTENVKHYLTEITKSITTGNGDIKGLLVEGQTICEKHKQGAELIGFLMPLVKDYPNDSEYSDRLAKLSSVLYDLGRNNAAELLAMAYFNQYPEGKYAVSLKKKSGEISGSIKEKLTVLAENVFKDPDNVGINKSNAQKYVDGCEAYALGYPNAGDTPLYLYRGAEIARTLRSYNKALSIFDWIIEKYPNHEKTPTTLFLKGFMLENELDDKVKAKEAYELFKAKYPKHELVDDIQFLLENIDKSDKEIMEMIENKEKK